MYDTISLKEFIDFFQLKVIDNFNISKINVKFDASGDVTWVHTASSTFLHSLVKLFDYFYV